MKETFIIRTEWFRAIQKLSETEQALIFRNLFYYHIDEDGKIETPTIGSDLVWSMIEPNLHRNIKDYDRRKETSAENGKLGGRPSNNLNNLNRNLKEPKKASVTAIVTVSDSVPESESELVSASATDGRFFEIAGERIDGMSPFEYAMKNFQIRIEADCMNFGCGRVPIERLRREFEIFYPVGSAFQSNDHLQKALRKKITLLAKTIESKLPNDNWQETEKDLYA